MRGQQIGVVVKAAREKKGMSQESLAYLAGTTSDAIWGIEKGSRIPRWDTLARIAAVLEIPASALDSAIEHEVAAARAKVPQSERDLKALREQARRMRERHSER